VPPLTLAPLPARPVSASILSRLRSRSQIKALTPTPTCRFPRPDPKLADDTPHNIHAQQRAASHTGTKLSDKEQNFLKIFDHESREYAQVRREA